MRSKIFSKVNNFKDMFTRDSKLIILSKTDWKWAFGQKKTEFSMDSIVDRRQSRFFFFQTENKIDSIFVWKEIYFRVQSQRKTFLFIGEFSLLSQINERIRLEFQIYSHRTATRSFSILEIRSAIFTEKLIETCFRNPTDQIIFLNFKLNI